MQNYKLIIFDLDGTLADTSAGIYKCHQYTNTAMGRSAPTNAELANVIGGPLLRTYTERFGFSEEDAEKAVKIYRKHYADIGIKGSSLYDGMAETLNQLKQRGYLLSVATLKEERLAKSMLAELGVDRFFDVIHGVDDSDKLTKAALIELCINELGVSCDESVLVGDSEHDAAGASEAGVSFIACTYGFGYSEKSDTPDGTVSVISQPAQLLDLFR